MTLMSFSRINSISGMESYETLAIDKFVRILLVFLINVLNIYDRLPLFLCVLCDFLVFLVVKITTRLTKRSPGSLRFYHRSGISIYIY
jgi:hypothetical protein